jgi:hypothetical protein
MVLDSLGQEPCSFQAAMLPIFDEVSMKLDKVESVKY